ncbi:cartilage intermediate layer protein 1 isoform X1 [Rana temporaria]|uniref:cartilage intermediate layer protein 1 isoform X1 n=1 Tax=Rana temporaria TaxID=8407 RepID=UPI001AAC4DFD|nr:cartilage intermediate layer protein 1 isoform X1 [Rana temporaria]
MRSGLLACLLFLEVAYVSGQGSRNSDGVLNHSARRIRVGKKGLSPLVKKKDEFQEWTTWFNIDHPGGNGDYERLDAIRFYYPSRVCQKPLRMEARTTEWVPAGKTGEVVHYSLARGFWCINKEQPEGKNCSNYSVRFLCPVVLTTSLPKEPWSEWSAWSECSAKCGSTGMQIRRRTCLAEDHWQEHCNGPTEEGRRCTGQPCTECNMSCPVGKASADCSVCECKNQVLYGTVTLPDGAPAVGANVYIISKKPKLKAISDSLGKFRAVGLCPDSTLQLKMEKYSVVNLKIPKSNSTSDSIAVTLKRKEKPYIMENPETKVRRVGQSVTFCCNAVGEPAIEQYLWYHNGTLLDQSIYKSNNQLVLRKLKTSQAGEYYCKAKNDAGFVKSSPAKLKLIANEEHACNSKPEKHLIRLPHDCFQNGTNSFYYNVGKCPSTSCPGDLENGLRCKDAVPYCCGTTKTQEKEISCQGYVLPVKVAVECGCLKCAETKIIVRGRAIASDTGEPMRFGHIYMGNARVSMTGYKGTFSIQVPADTERLVLTFVDRLQKFVNTTKVLPFNKKGGTVFHEIHLLRRKEPVILDSMNTNQIALGEVENSDPIAELEIPPNSFYRQNGEPYNGKVKASVTFLDPRNVSTAPAAQSDLNFVNAEGDTMPLRSYGMFSVDFTDEKGIESLNAGAVKVFLDSTQVKMSEHLEKMKLWSLNPETGLWEEEGDFVQGAVRRGKREERTFLVGNMEIRERRLFNLDVPESRRCYVKIRAYRSERFLPSEQIEGVVVNLINMEPTPGFSSNPRAWGRFDSAITGSNGACLPAFCDDQSPDAYSAFVTATLGGEELEPVESSPKFNPNIIGVPQPYLNKLNYRRTDHDDPKVKKTAFSINVAKPSPNAAEESNGPVYAYDKLLECEEAPYNAAHFRFYRVEGDRYDFNSVSFNEDDPMSWTADYLAWWPKPMEYRACYMKVKIIGPQEIIVRSRNTGGTHPQTVGQLYGIRDVRSTRDMEESNLSSACIEFKCSGMLYDQDRVDRTLVKIVPQGSCQREAINTMLHEYLINHVPMAVNNDTNEYTMLAPLDPLGHNYGIYTVTDQDPRTAKEIALGRCFDGTSDGTSRVMKSNVGVALTFNCLDRDVGQQSVFRAGNGLAAASAARQGGRNGRQQRESSGPRLTNRLRALLATRQRSNTQ